MTKDACVRGLTKTPTEARTRGCGEGQVFGKGDVGIFGEIHDRVNGCKNINGDGEDYMTGVFGYI